MIELFSTEFWIATLFIIDFLLVLFLFLFVKKVNQFRLAGSDQAYYDVGQEDIGPEGIRSEGIRSEEAQYASGSALDIIAMLKPLVKESKKTAVSFDEQIKEKRRLIKELNEALDSRIISINLLLSRADTLQRKLEEKQSQPPVLPQLQSTSIAVFDQQNQILEMHNQSFDIDSIAQQLSIPKGEVQLVVDLKKRFVAMEKNSR